MIAVKTVQASSDFHFKFNGESYLCPAGISVWPLAVAMHLQSSYHDRGLRLIHAESFSDQVGPGDPFPEPVEDAAFREGVAELASGVDAQMLSDHEKSNVTGPSEPKPPATDEAPIEPADGAPAAEAGKES